MSQKQNQRAAYNYPRMPISTSLLMVPEDALEGYQERIDRCVDWNLSASAIRHHQLVCSTKEIPPLSFTEAFQNKIKKSILSGFLDEESTLSLQEHYDITLPIAMWDDERSATRNGQISFLSENNITDNLLHLLKWTVLKNDREILRSGLKNSLILRVTDSKMTYLDKGLTKFKFLTTLSLCGNYIKEMNCKMLPKGLRALELQANAISSLDSFTDLPDTLLYLGLSKNLLTNESLAGIAQFPRSITVLDFSDNDIYQLEPLLDVLARLPCFTSLMLQGNPCSVCAGYALTTVARLHRLRWLDNRQVLSSDRPYIPFEPHPDDLRSAWFNFTIIRVISAPKPPNLEKGQLGLFFVEAELPLFDSTRRAFLMFRRYESLEELLPLGEDEISVDRESEKDARSAEELRGEGSDTSTKLVEKNSRLIKHYTTYESNRVQWNKVMNFQEPTIRLFCPDIMALRNTFRSTITIKLMYMLYSPQSAQGKGGKEKKTKTESVSKPVEKFLNLATIKCSLRNPDWSQHVQYFHWDDSLGTNEAIHWGDADLSLVKYAVDTKASTARSSKQELDKCDLPENLTCHFGFGIDTLRA